MYYTVTNLPFDLVYEGEGEGSGDGQVEGSGTNDGAGGNAGAGAGTGSSYTKEQVEQIVQQRLARQRQSTQKTVEQLEKMKQDYNLSVEQTDQLQSQIDELKSTLMTKEELAAQEKKRLQSDYESKLKSSEEVATRYKTLFESSTIERALTDAAITAEAVLPQQIVDLLAGRSRLVELKDDSGKATGEYQARVKIQGLNEENKHVTLDLPVAEAIPQMKKFPQLYGNLFKDAKTGGVGGTNTNPGSTNINPNNVSDMDTYMKLRASLLKE